MNFFTRYNPPPSPVRLICGSSKTRQEFQAECDINYIVSRVGAGLARLEPPTSGYIDLTGVPDDYQACLDSLNVAAAQFAALPSALRDRFGNDPSRLFEFLSDERNRSEAERLGLIAKREQEKSVDSVLETNKQ